MKIHLAFAAFAATLFAQSNPFVPQAPAPAPAKSSDTELAVVDGHPVTLEDVRKMLDSAPPQLVQFFHQNPQMAIQQYFMIKFLAEQGEKTKLAETSPLKEQIEMARANAVAVAMVNHERDGLNVTNDMIKSFYDSNRSRYEQAKVKIIYIAFKAGSGDAKPKSPEEAAKEAMEQAHPYKDRSEADAKKIADEVGKQIKAGAKFEALVAKYSEDETSKAKGGEFGFIKATSPYPEDLKKAVFAMKQGDVSDPIRQSNGFYFIQLEEKTAQPMIEVTEAIVQEIRQNHLNDWMNGLNNRFKPTVKNQEFFLKPDSFLNAK